MAHRKITGINIIKGGKSVDGATIMVVGDERATQKLAEAYALVNDYVRVESTSDNPHLRKDVVYLLHNAERNTVQPYFGSKGLKRVKKMIEDGK